ncbi:MAG: conjugal transfer transcriptional regulator TraJ [Rhodocyclaceae bacterium]|nr:conjugal transfer transcriptional regulator TraJ [Rhodocyclaceae bacterium]
MSEFRPARREHAPIKVYCLPEERQMIASLAAATGLSLSAYLLAVGQGYLVSSRVDREQVRELALINGDLGRLGGLLKLWLTDEVRAMRHGVNDIRGLLHKIEARQEQMGALMASMSARTQEADA